MSAEQLKAAVREYAREHQPECKLVSVVLDLGIGRPAEVLIVRPGPIEHGLADGQERTADR